MHALFPFQKRDWPRAIGCFARVRRPALTRRMSVQLDCRAYAPCRVSSAAERKTGSGRILPALVQCHALGPEPWRRRRSKFFFLAERKQNAAHQIRLGLRRGDWCGWTSSYCVACAQAPFATSGADSERRELAAAQVRRPIAARTDRTARPRCCG